ncbi:MAG: hypothetical protein AB7O65_06060 [Candidatus Korobacteraceae bacterium]
MKFLTSEEATEWCEARGVTVSPDHYLSYDVENFHSFTVALDEKPSRVIGLADYLVPTWDDVPFKGALLWIRATDIWGDHSEKTGAMILQQLRLAKEERHPVDERPGHLFGPDELIELHSCFVLPLLFGWDAFLVPEGENYFVFISHDEVVKIVSPNADASAEVQQRVKTWQNGRG